MRNGTLLSLKSLHMSLIQNGSVLNERKMFKMVYGDIRDINGKKLVYFSTYYIGLLQDMQISAFI